MQDLLNEMLLCHVDKDQHGSISVSLQTNFIHVLVTLKASLKMYLYSAKFTGSQST